MFRKPRKPVYCVEVPQAHKLVASWQPSNPFEFNVTVLSVKPAFGVGLILTKPHSRRQPRHVALAYIDDYWRGKDGSRQAVSTFLKGYSKDPSEITTHIVFQPIYDDLGYLAAQEAFAIGVPLLQIKTHQQKEALGVDLTNGEIISGKKLDACIKLELTAEAKRDAQVFINAADSRADMFGHVAPLELICVAKQESKESFFRRHPSTPFPSNFQLPTLKSRLG